MGVEIGKLLPEGWTQNGVDVQMNGGRLVPADNSFVDATGLQSSNGDNGFMSVSPADGVYSQPSTAAAAFGADGSSGATVALDAGGLLVSNVLDPATDQDAATKKYVDDNAGGGSLTNPIIVPLEVEPADPTSVRLVNVEAPAGFQAQSSDTQLLRLAGEGDEQMVSFDAYGYVDIKGATGTGAATVSVSERDEAGYVALNTRTGVALRAIDATNMLIALRDHLNAVVFEASSTGHVRMTGLPTSDPGVAGSVWNDGGTLKISAGP